MIRPKLVCFLMIASALPLYAQLVSVKTVPVVTGDQFVLYPSQNMAMGNVDIAMDDMYYDPFVNPAKGCKIVNKFTFLTSPCFYSVSDGNGRSVSTPVSFLYKGDHCFGGGSFAYQRQELNQPVNNQFSSGTVPLNDKYADNYFSHVLIGKNLKRMNASIAVSMYYADLKAMDGIEYLYRNSLKLEQDGFIRDVRFAFDLEPVPRQFFEMVLLYNQVKMAHTLTELSMNLIRMDSYYRYFPLPNIETKYKDQTNTWGVHTGYNYQFKNKNRIGAIFSMNRKSHPKIPDYDIMNIPRDPGHTTALNIGLGASAATRDSSILAFDFIYEPIWSNTWADAERSLVINSNQVIKIGEKTVENDFYFSNYKVRAGFQTGGTRFRALLGTELYSIKYKMKQYNYIQSRLITLNENWKEWTLSFGCRYSFTSFSVQYSGRFVWGTGIPQVIESSGFSIKYDSFTDNLILAPSGKLTVEELRVFTNQLTLSVPF